MAATDRRIKSVFLFQNGMVAVCDQYGEQMSVFQGPYGDALRDRIEAAATADDVEWFGWPNKKPAGETTASPP